MSDPRNSAHAKKTKHSKERHPNPPGHPGDGSAAETRSGPAPVLAKMEHDHVALEKSLSVLSKLKDMEFHSRANMESLAGLVLTIDDELKQKEFSDPIGALYSAQDAFETKIAALIESYHAKCETMKEAD